MLIHKARAAVVKALGNDYDGKIIAIAEVPVRVTALGYRGKRMYAGKRRKFEIYAIIESRAAERTGLAAHTLHVVQTRAVTADERGIVILEFGHALGQIHADYYLVVLERAVTDVLDGFFAVFGRAVVIFCENI